MKSSNLTARSGLVAVAMAALGALLLAACATTSGGSDIVFTSERDSDEPDIYKISGSGGEAKRLTNTAAIEERPKWSPERGRIAFLSDRGGGFELYVMDSEGESEQVAVGGDGQRYDFSWGPDGNRIAYVSDHEGELFVYVKDLQLNQRFRLSITHDTEQQLGGWSPDGDWIVFSVLSGNGRGIYRKNPGGVDEVRLTEDRDESPAYSPDGRMIAFISTRDAEESEIYVMDSDGENERNLTRKTGADSDFDWSPDSKSLVFISERDGNPEIYLMSVDGNSEPQRLTTNNSRERSPRFSPDGKRIVFVSDSDGDFDVFTMARDGSDQRRVTATDRDDVTPDW